MSYKVEIITTATKADGTIIPEESGYVTKIATKEQAENYLRYNKLLKHSLTSATYRDNQLVEIHGSYISKCVINGLIIKETLYSRNYYLMEEEPSD